jgi:hypothetical protein
VKIAGKYILSLMFLQAQQLLPLPRSNCELSRFIVGAGRVVGYIIEENNKK